MSETETIDQPTKKVDERARAVAVINHGGHMQVTPQDLPQQIEFAKLMSTAGPMLGKPFRGNVGACLGICNQAWQWGMNPYAVSQKAYLVNEVIAFEAQLVHAVILKLAPLDKRPRPSYEGEGDKRRCTITFHVKGEDEPLTYTSPEFSKITPKNSPLWKADPDQQLFYYTIRAGARRYFPEVLMGVLDYEEAVFIAEAEERKDRTYTLGGDAIEAEYTKIDTVLERAQEAKPAADRKKAARKDRQSGGDETTPAPVTPTGAKGERSTESEAPAAEATANADKVATADPATNEPETDEDAAIVNQVETDLRGARTGRIEIIRAQRGALERIAQTHEDGVLRARARALLDKFDLD